MEQQLNVVQLIKDPSTGQFVFANGNLAYLLQIQYSPDGFLNWENKFNPLSHYSEFNPLVLVGGHKYLRIKANPTSEWTAPAKFVGEDAEDISLSTYEKLLILHREGQADITLFDFSVLKGDQGNVGPAGKGCTIDEFIFFNELATVSTVGSSCNSCGPAGASTETHKTVLILGDNRTHEIVGTDWVGEQYHKELGTETTWTRTDPSHLGLKVRFYGYDGVNSVSVNDATLENTLGEKGKLYIYNNGIWINIGDIAEPDYRVAPDMARATQGAYMADYVILSNTVYLTGGAVLEVKNNSIAARHLLDGTFTHGFDESDGLLPIKIYPRDFAGYGLKGYISTASGEEMLQIDLSAAAGDGIQVLVDVSADGEEHQVFQVNVADLVNIANNGGIITAIGPDGIHLDLVIQTAKPLFLEDDKVKIQADEDTITVLLPDVNSAKLQVKETDDIEDGIQGKHIHANAYDNTKGIGSRPGSQAYIIINPNTFEFDADNTFWLAIKDDAIHGYHLNPDIVSLTNDHAIKFEDDILKVIPDDVTIHIVGGKLEVLEVTEDKIPSDNVVKSVQIGNGSIISMGVLQDNIKLHVEPKGGVLPEDNLITITTSYNVVENEGRFKLSISKTILDTLLTGLNYIKSISAISWGTLQKTVGVDAKTIQEAIDETNILNVTLGSNNKFRLDTTHGFIVMGGDDMWHKILVDINGNVYSGSGFNL